jgi:hypothetical protein
VRDGRGLLFRGRLSFGPGNGVVEVARQQNVRGRRVEGCGPGVVGGVHGPQVVLSDCAVSVLNGGDVGSIRCRSRRSAEVDLGVVVQVLLGSAAVGFGSAPSPTSTNGSKSPSECPRSLTYPVHLAPRRPALPVRDASLRAATWSNSL